MSFESEMDGSLSEMIREMGSHWVYRGVSILAIQDDFQSGLDYQIEGNIESGEFRLTFSKNAFGNFLPKKGDRIGNETTKKEYRILKVSTSEGDPGINLECGSVDQ